MKLAPWPLVLFLALPAAAQGPVEAARAWRAEHGPRILRDYAALLALPNVSSDRAGIR